MGQQPSQQPPKLESFTDLKLGTRLNAHRSPINMPESSIEPASNFNLTSGSTPNIKLKSKNGMHPPNGHHNNNSSFGNGNHQTKEDKSLQKSDHDKPIISDMQKLPKTNVVTTTSS